MTSALFSPYKINGLELANRIVVAPMCQYSADDGVPSPGTRRISACWRIPAPRWWSSRRPAWSGAAASPTAAPASIRTTARTRFARVIAHCKRIGTAKFGIQIAHAGRKASSARPWEGGLGLKPDRTRGRRSALGDRVRRRWPAPRAMDEADMAHVRELSSTPQARAARGFDTIELHMAHGYLMHSLRLADLEQAQRRYGGSLEGRMKFPLEVLRAVRAVVPKDYAARRAHLGDRLDGRRPHRRRLACVGAADEGAGLDFVCVSPAASPRMCARRPRPATTCRSPSRSSARPASRPASSA
jgi:NADPH2 dehydrogenase